MLPSWFDDTFILSLLGLMGGGGGACIYYLLRSRCTSVRLGCISCERDVLPAEQVSTAV